MKNIKKSAEVIHGKKIKDHAESVWGWASPAGKIRAQRRAEYLCDLGNFVNSNFVLELGCGTGEFTSRFLRKGVKKLAAVDISFDLIKKAKEKCQENKVYFIVADAEALPFKGKAFDEIVGVSILHHLNLGIILREVYRTLKQKGKLVFSEPNMLNPQIFLVKNILFLKRLSGDVDSESAFIRWRVKNTLKGSGFSAIKVFPFDFLHPATPAKLVGFVSLLGRLVERIPVLKEISGSLLIYAQKV
ncbi:MAG: class I SAM-dependent methyltransferase [Candidatus Omnitrophica bacterium]|nr:class I SAM-dependent methyltransferase [Candidatus Omnitrophota bacterium]